MMWMVCVPRRSAVTEGVMRKGGSEVSLHILALHTLSARGAPARTHVQVACISTSLLTASYKVPVHIPVGTAYR
jgi:hypothetical protein